MLVFVRGHFSLSQASATGVLLVAGAGSLAGLLVAGRLADALIRRGILTGRVLVAGIGYIAAAVILLPGLLVTTLAIAMPLLVLAGALLMAPNPPLAAARLDIMPAQLWGRAEGVGTLVRHTAQAGAPLLFGIVADALTSRAGTVSSRGAASAATAHGVGQAFLIMLVPLALSGIVLFAAGRSYPADVATAAASEQHATAK